MIRLQTTAIALILGLAVASSAPAAEPVPIGMITTLSGSAGYQGEDVRDAFQLVIDEEGGTLGGVPVSMLIEDDALNPGKGKQIAERFLKQGKVRIFTGILYSNVLLAALPDILKSGAFYVSPNAGPSNFAGKDCNPNFFVVSWQNDEPSKSAGQNATQLGFKKMFAIAPNYEAGKDAVNGFKRFYKGEIVGEIYNKLDQTDFATELAQNPRGQARCGLRVRAGRPRHRLHQTIYAGRSARFDPARHRRHLDGRPYPRRHRRGRARHQPFNPLGRGFRQFRQPPIRLRLQGEVPTQPDLSGRAGL